jgi:hypothetical protein
MAEKRTVELEIKDNSKSLKSQYREAVQELQKVSAQYGETSKEAVKAARAAAELKDQIGFSKDLVDAFNPDAKFKAVEGAVNGVMNGFQAFTGGMALLGVESEKVEEALLKVQSVMALTQGINGLMEAGDSFKQLGAAAKNALSGIKTGIAATGIGLLVVGLGAVVAYWDDIKEAVGGVGAEQKKLNVDAEKHAASSKKSYENAQLEENALRLQGKTEKEILQIRINKINSSIEDEAIRIQGLETTAKLEIAAAERNQKITEDIMLGALQMSTYMIRLLMKPLDLVIATINKGAEVLGFSKVIALDIDETITQLTKSAASAGSKLLFDPKAVKAESAATIAEAKKGLKQMQSDRDGFLIQIKQNNVAATNSSSSAAVEQIDITRKLKDDELSILEDGFDKEMALLNEKRKREKEDAEKQFKEGVLKKEDYNKLLASIDSTYEADRKKIYEKDTSEQIKARDYNIENLIASKIKEGDIEIEAAGKKIELDKKTNEEIAANQKRINDAKIGAAKDTLQVISNLTELFAGKSKAQQKKAFQVQKAVSIAGATIDTYKAAASALKDSPAPFNYIAMAAVITAGLLNVKKIASQKFEGGGASGGGGGASGGGGAAATMTPQFNVVGNNGINQLAQLQQQPVQAYVVSGEVTTAQSLDRNRVQNATL